MPLPLLRTSFDVAVRDVLGDFQGVPCKEPFQDLSLLQIVKKDHFKQGGKIKSGGVGFAKSFRKGKNNNNNSTLTHNDGEQQFQSQKQTHRHIMIDSPKDGTDTLLNMTHKLFPKMTRRMLVRGLERSESTITELYRPITPSTKDDNNLSYDYSYGKEQIKLTDEICNKLKLGFVNALSSTILKDTELELGAGLKPLSNPNWKLSFRDPTIKRKSFVETGLRKIYTDNHSRFARLDPEKYHGIITTIYYISGGIKFIGDRTKVVLPEDSSTKKKTKPTTKGDRGNIKTQNSFTETLRRSGRNLSFSYSTDQSSSDDESLNNAVVEEIEPHRKPLPIKQAEELVEGWKYHVTKSGENVVIKEMDGQRWVVAIQYMKLDTSIDEKKKHRGTEVSPADITIIRQ